jgi:hypothetical protein
MSGVKVSVDLALVGKEAGAVAKDGVARRGKVGMAGFPLQIAPGRRHAYHSKVRNHQSLCRSL